MAESVSGSANFVDITSLFIFFSCHITNSPRDNWGANCCLSKIDYGIQYYLCIRSKKPKVTTELGEP